MLYEIHDIRRFPEEGQFLSYARLVRCAHESAGKKKGTGGNKIGNAHLKWAFSEATCLLLRASERAKAWLARRERKHGKKRALGGAGGAPGAGRLPPAPQGRGVRRAALLRQLRASRRAPGPGVLPRPGARRREEHPARVGEPAAELGQ